jgi:formylglycine-generating enzyme required for sulfatase activity
MIPRGTYPIGVPSVDGRRNPNPYSENEIVYRDSIIPGTGNTLRVPAKLFVTISANLYIDQYEVTNALYVKFLNTMLDSARVAYDLTTNVITLVETGATLITLDSDLTRIFYVDEEVGFSVESTERNFPVTGVTWQGAKSYCARYGMRLPTEYEWEIAARLTREFTTAESGYLYPWTPDTQINGAYANFRDSGDPFESSNNLRAETPVASYSDIDSLMASWPHENAVGPVGTYDQAGNVSEWVDDWYVKEIYTTLRAKYDVTGRWPVDPQTPKESESSTTPATRVIRGGSFFDSADFIRVTLREAGDPLVGSATVGFRGVYTEFNP